MTRFRVFAQKSLLSLNTHLATHQTLHPLPRSLSKEDTELLKLCLQ